MPRNSDKYYHCTTCHFNVRRTIDGVDHSWRCTPGTITKDSCAKCTKDKRLRQQAIISQRTQLNRTSENIQFPHVFVILPLTFLILILTLTILYLTL